MTRNLLTYSLLLHLNLKFAFHLRCDSLDLIKENSSLNDALLREEMKKTANELLDSMQDTRFSETEFLKFVDDLKSQSHLKETNSLDTHETLWNNSLKELSAQELGNLSSEADAWVDEFQKSGGDSKNQFWDDLNDSWNIASK